MNKKHFEGLLDLPVLRWNPRLKTSAGRFMPQRTGLFRKARPVIEVASYLQKEMDSEKHIQDTLGHEMIHLWLWTRRRPYGHNEEFYKKLRSMGVSRYNPVPKTRPYRYEYRCPNCKKIVLARKRLGRVACAECCKKIARGKFDPRFILELGCELTCKSSGDAPT